jgi:hypothetical protein
MPHSIAWRKRMIWRAAEKFQRALHKTLKTDAKKLQCFYDTVKKLNSESAPRDTVIKQINTCMKKHPELCDRVVGFHPDGSLKLKETEPMEMVIPQAPPASFTSDTLLSILPLLPFPAIGRLAMTCKWMNATITPEQIETTLVQARERFGKVSLLTEPTSGRQMVCMFNTDDQMISVGKMHPKSDIYVLRMNGRTYLGESKWHDPTNLSSVLKHASSGFATDPNQQLVWFKYDTKGGDDDLYMRFNMISSGNLYYGAFRMYFREFVQ